MTFQQPGQKAKYQIHLKSQNGPICVLLVNHDSKTNSPTVVPVPPPPDQEYAKRFTTTSEAILSASASSSANPCVGSHDRDGDVKPVNGSNLKPKPLIKEEIDPVHDQGLLAFIDGCRLWLHS